MYEKIRRSAIFTFIACVVIATLVVILGIWNVFDKDVIGRSFASLGILLVSAVLITITTLIRDGKFASKCNCAGGTCNGVCKCREVSVGRIVLYVILVILVAPIFLSIFMAML